MTILRVKNAELSLLRDLAERTFRDTYESRNDPNAFNAYCDWAFTLDYVRAELEHPYSEFYFIREDQQLIAYLKFNFDQHPPEIGSQNTMQLQRIYIETVFQGKGVGPQLIQFAEQRAKTAGVEWLWLSVWQKAPPTVAFYEKCGFEIFGVEIFPLGDDPQPDWLMRKKISA